MTRPMTSGISSLMLDTIGSRRPKTPCMMSIGVSPSKAGCCVSIVQKRMPSEYISVRLSGSAGIRPVCSGLMKESLVLAPTSFDNVDHPDNKLAGKTKSGVKRENTSACQAMLERTKTRSEIDQFDFSRL